MVNVFVGVIKNIFLITKNQFKNCLWIPHRNSATTNWILKNKEKKNNLSTRAWIFLELL